MARLVIGTSKAATTPAVVKKVAEVPNYIAPKNNVNGVYVADNTATSFSFNGATSVFQFGLPYGFTNCTNLISLYGEENLLTVYEYGLFHAFQGSGLVGSVNLSSVYYAAANSFYYAFNGCIGITSADLSSLTSITTPDTFNNCFSDCTNLTSCDLSSLESVTGARGLAHFVENCTSITRVDLSSLISATGNQALDRCFRGCTSLTSMTFNSLSTATGAANGLMQYCFADCTSLTSLSFPALTSTSFGTRTNQFDSMLNGVTGCTVHFPSNVQSVIGSWTSVTNGFSGTDTIVLFDLPATVTLTGADTVTYTRNPKYDTATALAWKVGAYGTTNFTPAYYTSGLTDPTVGTTIYSDSACTTTVTTVASIA